MTRFVNRVDELSALERWWSAANDPLGIVWGRRRVGKTMLLQRFAKGKRVVFHSGAGRPVADELRILSVAAGALETKSSRDPGSRPFTGWDDALDWSSDQSADQPLLLVFDEFPELVAVTPELPGILRVKRPAKDPGTPHPALRLGRSDDAGHAGATGAALRQALALTAGPSIPTARVDAYAAILRACGARADLGHRHSD